MMRSRRLDALTCLPRQLLGTWSEKAVIPLLLFMPLLSFLPLRPHLPPSLSRAFRGMRPMVRIHPFRLRRRQGAFRRAPPHRGGYGLGAIGQGRRAGFGRGALHAPACHPHVRGFSILMGRVFQKPGFSDRNRMAAPGRGVGRVRGGEHASLAHASAGIPRVAGALGLVAGRPPARRRGLPRALDGMALVARGRPGDTGDGRSVLAGVSPG